MGIFASFIAGASLFYLQRYFPWSSFSLVLLFIFSWTLYKWRRPPGRHFSGRAAVRLAASILIPIVFIALGYWRAAAVYVPQPDMTALSGQKVELKGRLLAAPLRLQSERVRYLNEMEIKEATLSGKSFKADRIRLFTEDPLRIGQEYSVLAKFPADNAALNPGSREGVLSAYALEVNEDKKADRNLLERSRDRLNAYITANFKGDAGAFLMSIITGDRGSMSREIKNAFNVTGLAHILSISGAHFGLLLFICFKFFKLIVKLLPDKLLLRITLYVSPSQVAALLCLPIITAYLGISTMEFPAVRSFIMILLFLFGLLIHRKGFWMNTILLAAAIIVMIQPDALTQLSCQLSFLAVACLGFYADIMKKKEERKNDEKNAVQGEEKVSAPSSLSHKALMFGRQYVLASSMISAAATAGTAPLVAYSFNYLSIISPLSNMLVTPFIGFVILPLTLMSSFTYLIFGVFPFSAFIDGATNLALDVIRFMGSWDFAAIRVAVFPGALLVTFYSAMAAYAIISLRGSSQKKGKYHKRAVAGCIMAAVLPFTIYAASSMSGPSLMKTTFLDVGQGDSAVVELPDKKVMVIDTGKTGFQLANFLKYRGVRKIDRLVLTHGHPDHAGGLAYLLDNFKVVELWDNNFIAYPAPIPAGIVVRHVERGDLEKAADYRMTVFHPYKEFYTSGSANDAENNQSAVIKLEGRGNSFLFTGDISAEAEEDISYLGSYLKSTVLKVPHHGSRRSLTEGFLSRVSPKIAVVSAGRNNMFGHPHAETLERLAGARVFVTSKDGAVGITEMPDGALQIKTWQQEMMKEAKTFDEEYRNIKKLFRVW